MCVQRDVLGDRRLEVELLATALGFVPAAEAIAAPARAGRPRYLLAGLYGLRLVGPGSSVVQVESHRELALRCLFGLVVRFCNNILAEPLQNNRNLCAGSIAFRT